MDAEDYRDHLPCDPPKVYLIVTECKTSGLTDTTTIVREAYLSKTAAEKALKRHLAIREEDFYHGNPEIKELEIGDA